MNDAFAWDIGDLAKFVLLRQLSGDAADRLPLGAVWCYTCKRPRVGDGRHTAYLTEGDPYGLSVRERDPALYDLMQRGFRAGRSITTPEYRALLPDDTRHVFDAVDDGGARSAYWISALRATVDAAIVFFDPDNGIAEGTTPTTVSYAELRPFWTRGQSLVIYQHQDRDKSGLAALASDRILGLQRELGCAEVFVLRWHRYQARLFFVVPSATHAPELASRVRVLLASQWGTMLRDGLPDFSQLSVTPAPRASRPVAERVQDAVRQMSEPSHIEPIVGNKNVEDAAIRFVIEQERRFGREARDTRHRGAAADVESGGRTIEVKAFGGWLRAQGALLLEARQVHEARRNAEFYVYVVENVAQGDPGKFELRVIGGSQLKEVLAAGKEHRYFEIPTRAGEYARLSHLDKK